MRQVQRSATYLQQRCAHKHQCAAAATRRQATAAAAPRATAAMLRLLTILALLRAAEAGITLEFGTKKKPRKTIEAKAVEKKEEEKPQAPPPPPFVSRGWLMKKGRKRRNWKRRYFVLSDDWSDLGVPRCGGAFTPSTRVVSRRGGRGWSLFRI